MSPEQEDGRIVTVESDVYGLGAMLYVALTKQFPPKKIGANAHLPSRENNKLDKALDAIVSHCLNYDPAARYSSAQGLADDLGKWLRGEINLIARSPSPGEQAFAFVKRHPIIVTSVTAGIVAAVVSTWFALDAQRAKVAEQRERWRLVQVSDYVFHGLHEKLDQAGQQHLIGEIIKDLADRMETLPDEAVSVIPLRFKGLALAANADELIRRNDENAGAEALLLYHDARDLLLDGAKKFGEAQAVSNLLQFDAAMVKMREGKALMRLKRTEEALTCLPIAESEFRSLQGKDSESGTWEEDVLANIIECTRAMGTIYTQTNQRTKAIKQLEKATHYVDQLLAITESKDRLLPHQRRKIVTLLSLSDNQRWEGSPENLEAALVSVRQAVKDVVGNERGLAFSLR